MGVLKKLTEVDDKFLFVALLIFSMLAFMPAQVSAQDFSGAFSGMQDTDKPIQIESDRLEVKDKAGIALFTGNVQVVQGSTILKAKHLKVVYVKGGKGPSGNLKYLEASGKIAVRSGDQRVTADKGEFNMEKQTVKLSGDVIITQGSSVVSGCILEVDLETSSAVLKPCASQKRAVMVFDTKNTPKK